MYEMQLTKLALRVSGNFVTWSMKQIHISFNYQTAVLGEPNWDENRSTDALGIINQFVEYSLCF